MARAFKCYARRKKDLHAMCWVRRQYYPRFSHLSNDIHIAFFLHDNLCTLFSYLVCLRFWNNHCGRWWPWIFVSSKSSYYGSSWYPEFYQQWTVKFIVFSWLLESYHYFFKSGNSNVLAIHFHFIPSMYSSHKLVVQMCAYSAYLFAD